MNNRDRAVAGMRMGVRDWRGAAARALPWLRAALWLLLAVQAARLLWALVTPVSVLGDWRAPLPSAMPAAARQALFAAFDPFATTRGAAGDVGAGRVTSLSLILFGVRIDEATGGGSAIIATPDGVQSSYAVGEELVPGVRLKAVAYDHVVLDRGGAEETLYIDQSGTGASPARPQAGAEGQ